MRDSGSTEPVDPAEPQLPTPAAASDTDIPAAPTWWEDPELAAAVAEVEEFAGTAGWDAPPQIFALVRTADLLSAQPDLAGSLEGPSTFTAIGQEALAVEDPPGDLSVALAQISWPAEVAGCVLVQEIVVLPPNASTDPDEVITDAQAAAHPERREARLVAGVLRDLPGGACLLRVRDADTDPLRGGDLAPNLLAALQATFLD